MTDTDLQRAFRDVAHGRVLPLDAKLRVERAQDATVLHASTGNLRFAISVAHCAPIGGGQLHTDEVYERLEKTARHLGMSCADAIRMPRFR